MVVVLFDILNINPFMEMLMTKMFSFSSYYFKGRRKQGAQQPRTWVALRWRITAGEEASCQNFSEKVEQAIFSGVKKNEDG